MFRSNQLDQTIALSLTEYIKHETDYSPLRTFITNMNYIGSQLALRDTYGIFKVTICIRFLFAYGKKVGMSAEQELT